jgi:hypothetical protein
VDEMSVEQVQMKVTNENARARGEAAIFGDAGGQIGLCER